MYCKNCGFHSFDHLTNCPKCNQDWEKSRKELGLQWITETKGNWLEDIDETDTAKESLEQQITPQQDSFLDATEDDFTLEENWSLPETENQAPQSGEDEELVVTQTRTASPEQPSPDLPAAPVAPTLTEFDDEPAGDLLIPGLEEMLQVTDQATPQPSSQPQTDQNDADLVLTDETAISEAEKSLELFLKQEAEHLSAESTKKTVPPALVPDVSTSKKNHANTEMTKKNIDQDIVEINLDDLDFTLGKKSAQENK